MAAAIVPETQIFVMSSAALLAEEEARTLAEAMGEDGDELRFEHASFSVDGSLTGVAFSLALSAQGVATLRAEELKLVPMPAVEPLPHAVRVQFCEVEPRSLRLESPMFAPHHIAGVARSGSFRIDILADGATRALYDALRRAVVAVRLAAASVPRPLPLLEPTGRYFALVDPRAPVKLLLTEQLVPVGGRRYKID